MLRDLPMIGEGMRRGSLPRALAAAIAIASLLASCTKGEEERTESPLPAAGGGGHAHVAPHGGALIALGDELAHIELVFDPASGLAEAHILDGHAEKGVAIGAPELRFAVEGIAAPLLLRPVASALTGEEAGNTSRFSGVWPELTGRARFAATLEAVTVRGIEFREVSVRFPEGNKGNEDAGHGAGDGDGHDGHGH